MIQRFEEEILNEYKQGKIKTPIHLSGGNEEQLKDICGYINKQDWIFSTWRSHYHWLLSGRSPKELKKQIIDGHSMSVFGDRFFTSSIVGGIAPIAVGVAYSIKRRKSNDWVWCFIGDMASECGIVSESIRYAQGHDLPITFVIEDNGMSVDTNTKEVWGVCNTSKVTRYYYTRKYPHAGIGHKVLF